MSVTKRAPSGESIAVRADQAMIDEIDAVAKEICLPGGKPKRSEAMCALIAWGLREIDKVGLDALLARLGMKLPRGRGRGAMTFDEKKPLQTKRSVIDDDE